MRCRSTLLDPTNVEDCVFPGEQHGVALHQDFGALNAGLSDTSGGVALETLPESAVLAAVECEHRRIKRDAGKCAVDHAARDPLALRITRDGREEAIEVASAWRRADGRGEQEHDKNQDE